MQLFVEGVTSKTVTLEVEPSDTIESVKQKYQDREGVAASRQSLFYDGMELPEGRALSDYNVQKESTLQVFFKAIDLDFSGPLAWTGGESLSVEFTDGFSGIDVSQHRLNGALDLAGVSTGTPIRLNLETPFGSLQGFDPSQSNSWTILDDSAGSITGFSSDKFLIDTAAFGNSFEGDWSVSEGSLVLNYAPVPEPASFGGILGFLALGWRLLRHR